MSAIPSNVLQNSANERSTSKSRQYGHTEINALRQVLLKAIDRQALVNNDANVNGTSATFV
jgi:hypothetical protein